MVANEETSPQSASLTAPLRSKGSLLDSGMPQGVALPKGLLFPEGKREVARRRRDGGIENPSVSFADSSP